MIALALAAVGLVQPPVAGSQVTARRGFVMQTATAVAASAFVAVSPSRAGYVTNLGFGDAMPGKGDVDKDVLGSSGVQADLTKLAKYAALAKELAAKFAAEPQSDIKPIVASFNRAELRTALNSVGTVFSEDFQKQSDRLVRNVIQDLSELDSLVSLKEGTTRSPKKITSIARFTSKLDKDLTEFLSYVK
ncbi:hypothetical protein KFE25_000916 [Diacronema lutheri]|uniref:Uncharacterized protein n=1 Tax=Diacronema lutheri TaxID=2081491 RepID=A0A8J6C767_DIALT|nr:hypothetical protein KFE25_000916 [Diacronema lutheri]